MGIQIRIGSENNHFAMEDCSVITATYSVGEEQTGFHRYHWTDSDGLWTSSFIT